MKKLKMSVVAIVAMFAFVAMPAMAATSTYQVYSQTEDKLIVYSGDTADTAVVFTGRAEDYDGSAVSPQAPTSKYKEKQEAISTISSLERQGKTDEANKIKAYWHINK